MRYRRSTTCHIVLSKPCDAFYRHVISQNSKLFFHTIRHNLPNFPAQPSASRVDGMTNADRPIWKNLAKSSRLLHRGREPRGTAPARSLSAMGKIRASALPSACTPIPIPIQNYILLKGVDATALKGGREGKIRKTNTCMFKFRQKLRIKFLK